MSSNEISNLLYKLLHTIATGEQLMEDIRIVLLESEGFDPRIAFELVDFMSKGFITSDDIYKFMQEDSNFTPMTCYLILKEWDFNNSGHLSLNDFLKLLLPFNSHSNPGSSLLSQSLIASKSEFAVKKILRCELNYIKKVERAKHALYKVHQFAPSTCFNQIDTYGQGFLTFDSLSRFMQNFGKADPALIRFLIRRLDRDWDEKIGYTEFIQTVTPASKVYGSENNFSSVFTINTESSPRPAKVRKSKSTTKKPKTSGVQKFARFLMQQIMLEKELEGKRMELALRVDFTIGKLFRLFDKSCKGTVSVKEMEESLRYLGIIPELNQCHLLFRSYDRNNDNMLDYWDFYEIFNPRNKIYADLILNRISGKEAKDDLSIESLDLITDTFIVLLNIQTVTEELKQKLFSRNFDLQLLFEKIDINGLGFLTRGCFRNLLRQFKYYATDRDLEAILLIYDSNKEGKISYSKFVQGICPRQ